jgi:hypothetical protein
VSRLCLLGESCGAGLRPLLRGAGGGIDGNVATTDPITDLRRLSAEGLEKAGQDSLRAHLQAQAVVALQKHGPLSVEKLGALLNDRDCLRYPTRLVFEFGGMAAHQFAEPGFDVPMMEEQGRVLYLRPILRDRADLVVLAVAYMIPVLNCGDVVTDEHCLLYGALVLGFTDEEFYRQICALADYVGAEQHLRGTHIDAGLT